MNKRSTTKKNDKVFAKRLVLSRATLKQLTVRSGIRAGRGNCAQGDSGCG